MERLSSTQVWVDDDDDDDERSQKNSYSWAMKEVSDDTNTYTHTNG